MECNLYLEIENPELIKRAIETNEQNSGSLKTELDANEDLKIKIEADKISNLRAGVNTILRLLKVSQSATGI